MKFFKTRTSSFLLGSIILIFTPLLLYQYFVSGIYSWHIQKTGNQLSFLYVLSILGIACFFKSRIITNVLLVGLILLYAIFTGVIGSLILVIYYFLAFFLLGFRYNKLGLALQLSYGILFFVIIRSSLSIFLDDLLINEFIFIIIVSLLCFSSINSKESFHSTILKSVSIIDRKIIVLIFALITVGLNIATINYDLDSLWYPLRSNALYFDGDFFADNGFYGQVHFYPKLWESLTNNIFIEYNYSYGLSLCSALYIAIATIIHELFDKNKILNTLIVITTPVIVGLSFSLKTDLLLLTVFLISFIAVEKRRYDLVICALLLSFCIKNSAFLLVMSMIAYMYFFNKRNVIVCNSSVSMSYMMVSLSFIILTVFLYRTFLLTGLPIASPSSIISIQETFGFKFKIPMRIVSDQPSSSIFDIYKMIILPEEVRTHRFFYNGYLWAGSLFTFNVFVAIFFLPIFIIANSVVDIGDGNYYVVLTVVLTVLFLRKVEIQKIGYLLIMTNIIISVVANPNWVVPKIPSSKNVCHTLFCSDSNSISNQINYHNLIDLQDFIDDKNKRYFVISNNKPYIYWKLFHKYNVTHIEEFSTWNVLIPMYSLEEYLIKHADYVIIDKEYRYDGEHPKFDIENIYNQKNELPDFDLSIQGEKYTLHKKITPGSDPNFD